MKAKTEPREELRDTLTHFSAEGMIHVSTIRSPVAKGSVRGIELTRLPAGYRLILPADIPGNNSIVSFGTEIPILASEKISYRGEPVALVAGPDPLLLDELAARAKVDCKEEEASFSWETFSSEQVAYKRVAVVGDPDLAFSIASRVIQGTYLGKSLEHYYSEPQGAAASFDYDKMAIWCATQWPYHVRDSVSQALGCEKEEVSVRPTKLGVHLDGKLWYPSLLSCHAAIASVIMGRPAKLLLTREDDFHFTPKRAMSSIFIRTALAPNGDIAAMDLHVAVNVGAFAPLAEEILSQAVLASAGAYSCPNLRVEGYAVVTNTPPLGAFGGLGASHALFAVESHANRIAAELGEDPIDWKSRNVLRKGSLLMTGERLKDEPPFSAITDRIAKASDFHRKHSSYELIQKRRSGRRDGPLRGIGFAWAYQGSGPFLAGETSNSYTVEALLDKELGVQIMTSAAVGGEGVIELWKRTAATVLGVDSAAVTINPPYTDTVPNSGPSTLSRNVTVINKLVERACQAIQKKRFRNPLPLSGKSIYRVPKPIRWEAGTVQGALFDTAAWAGAVVELELDPWTFEPKPLGVWLCVDGGEIVAPPRALASLRAGVIDALGSCIRERVDPDSGGDAGDGYFGYGLPPLHELPPIRIEFLEPHRKTDAKGIGELPFGTVPSAFLSAASQAAGSHFFTLPISPFEVLTSLEES